MEWILVLIVIALVVGVVLAARRQRQQRPEPTSAGRGPAATVSHDGPLPGPSVTVTLDIAATDADDPSVERLVQDTARRTLRSSPDVEEVVVENRDGVHLATISREQQPRGPVVTEPLEEQPEFSTDERERLAPAPDPGEVPFEPPPSGSLADRFDLPPSVHSRLRDPDSAVDLIRAVLEAAGQPAEVQGNVIRSGSDVVVVLGEGSRGGSDARTDAFLKFQASGASRGLVVSFGPVGKKEVERREALEPNLRYVGASAVQRMADAAAVGGDPLTFARDPGAGE
ncbi:MAG: hypothetical protein R3343_14545 [Nitriliruptorales bacterium]|nr:hypothetical protein [Nitriliruptorales bacterium]